MQTANPNTPPLRFRKLRITWWVFWGAGWFVSGLITLYRCSADFDSLGGPPTPSSEEYADWPLYFLLALLCGAATFAPWLRLPYQFSLRTVLIATTLVAGVLGLGVYLATN